MDSSNNETTVHEDPITLPVDLTAYGYAATIVAMLGGAGYLLYDFVQYNVHALALRLLGAL